MRRLHKLGGDFFEDRSFITCLGHIARIYSKIDKEIVIPALKEKAKNKRFARRVEDAMDDIALFT